VSVADRLLRRLEANIHQSLGARSTDSPAEGGPATATAAGKGVIAAAGPGDGRARSRSAGYMDIRNVVPDPEQPRKTFDEEALRRLGESLKKFGQLMPIRVRWDERLGKWVILSGERRYRAALAAGLESVACQFIDRELSPSEILQEQIVENCLREDLRPVEQAVAYRELMELNGWSASALAQALSVSKSSVTKSLALLRLPAELRAKVDGGEIPATAAYELARLDGEEDQRAIASRIAEEGLSREQAVALVRSASVGEPRSGRRRKAYRPAESALSPPCPPLPIADRYAYGTDDHAVLVYSLEGGIKLTLTTPPAASGTDVARALGSAMEDVRRRLGEMVEPSSPWSKSPTWK
jgi:ParB family transcriptional regulator, chromosome partitioning protein